MEVVAEMVRPALGQLFDTLASLGIPALDLWPPYEGVEARRLAVTPFTDAHPNRYERSMADQAGSSPRVAARIAGVSRATRLSHVPEAETAIPGMGAIASNVVAALLSGFVLWVQHSRREVELERRNGRRR